MKKRNFNFFFNGIGFNTKKKFRKKTKEIRKKSTSGMRLNKKSTLSAFEELSTRSRSFFFVLCVFTPDLLELLMLCESR